MTDDFEWTEFNGEKGSRSADRHFEMSHDPSQGYTHIQKSLSTLKSGLDEFESEEQKTNAEIYANIDLFRETMQYIEEFGLYFRSRLDDDVNFVEGLTKTNTSEIKSLFTSIRDEGLLSTINNFIERKTPEEWLKEIFGYKHIELNDVAASDFDNVSIDDIEDAINRSLTKIPELIEEISKFFLRMDEPYMPSNMVTAFFPGENSTVKSR